ncbi:MAG: hypothetical protein JO332_14455 [Planctomycetaceae bacterium]|nr:hypothetical protein [Planctomycetaceae bacterium]
MFSIDRAPRYVAETCASAARLQEQTTPAQYAALVERAQRLLDGMFTVETNVDPDLQVRIALREKFEAARVKQAILMVATWRLVSDLANAWNVRKAPAPAAAPVRALALAAK